MSELSEDLYELAAGKDADGSDLDRCAQEALPNNFLAHLVSLALTKTGDALIQPKFTLAALLSSMGASSGLIGLLVPIRESLSMLPQFLLAGPVQRISRRKWIWSAGAVGQGLAVALMALTAVLLPSATGAAIIVGLLSLFALSRSLCSVTYKDVQGATVARGARGTVTGTAATLAALATLAFGLLLVSRLIERNALTLAGVLAIAATLWFVAAGTFTRIQEPARTDRSTGKSPFAVFRHLKTDRQLRLFLYVRALLAVTAIAPPYLMIAAGQDESLLSVLGPFLLAAAAAGTLSNYVWGRLSDRSSRWVLIIAAATAAAALAVGAALSLFDLSGILRLVVFAGILFVLLIAYEGVRLARSVHLVDMSPDDLRAEYTGATNTLMGVVLIATAAFAPLSSLIGVTALLAGFAAMAVCAGLLAFRLKEVQSDD